MNRFVLKNTFIKVHIYYFLINIFYKNKESKLGFGDRVIVLNDFFYGYRESISIKAKTSIE
jgi:hypothetical protein